MVQVGKQLRPVAVSLGIGHWAVAVGSGLATSGRTGYVCLGWGPQVLRLRVWLSGLFGFFRGEKCLHYLVMTQDESASLVPISTVSCIADDS